jgi:hypothetical protein
MIQNDTLIIKAATVKAALPQQFRLLKWNELVSRGDFIEDGHQGFELWEGPSGFRAGSFVKPTYRRQHHRPAGIGKPESHRPNELAGG